MYGTVIVLLIYDYKIISLNWLFILTELPDGGNRMANLVFIGKFESDCKYSICSSIISLITTN